MVSLFLFSLSWAGSSTIYAEPRLELSLLSATGRPWAQFLGGGALGAFGPLLKSRTWAFHTKASAAALYTADSSSSGADLRLGLFAGPRTRLVSTEHGLDLFYNGYGNNTAPDYYLAPTAGEFFRNAAEIRLHEVLNAHLWFNPAWVHNNARWADLWPMQEIHTGLALEAHSGPLKVTAGVRWAWNYSGRQRNLFLNLTAPLVLKKPTVDRDQKSANQWPINP